jgi:hypothetical protein
MNPAFSDLSREHWPELVSPEPNGLVADIDATFEQTVFNLTER